MAGAVRVSFVGTGDAFGSGGRLQTCIHVATAEMNYLLDCGCSSLVGLRRSGLAPQQIDTVIISHLHGDHFGGIPFLLLDGQYLSKRTRPLAVIGPQGVQEQVSAALSALYPGTLEGGVAFPVTYQELLPGQTICHGGLKISAWRMQHGSGDRALGLQVEGGGRRIAYTGDTEWNENLPLLAAGADLLICECFQYDRPTASHLDYMTLLEKRSQLDCRRIVLTHAGDDVLQRQDSLAFPLADDGFVLDL
ncbi:MAG: MBL fold metallo-hydrolase [Desulfuromonadales bacterium]|nr:MBL fold metallo-hydrolase [Desulfuromonadales bacterium]